MHTKITNTLGEVSESSLDQALSKYEGQQVRLQWLGAANEVFREEVVDASQARGLIEQSVGVGQTRFQISPAALRVQPRVPGGTPQFGSPTSGTSRAARLLPGRPEVVRKWRLEFSQMSSGPHTFTDPVLTVPPEGDPTLVVPGMPIDAGFVYVKYFTGTRSQAGQKLQAEACARVQAGYVSYGFGYVLPLIEWTPTGTIQLYSSEPLVRACDSNGPILFSKSGSDPFLPPSTPV